jgi:hypothetical protein
VEPEETFISRQLLGKHVPGAMNAKETIDVLLEMVFPVGSASRLYNDDRRPAEMMIQKSRVS